MKIKYLFAALGLITGLSSCEKDAIRGEGNVITNNISTTAFTAIDVSGATRLHVTYGSTFSVAIKGYANLLPFYDAKVRNKALILGFRNNYTVHNDNTEVFVTMPDLKRLHMSGSKYAEILGNFPHNESLYLGISGSADIDMESGSTDKLHVEVSGSGDINVFKVVAKNADISMSGSGKVRTNVTDNLDVSISGSGTIYYKGSPQIQSKISGSGKVVKQN